MLPFSIILSISLVYLCVLFAIAYWGDRSTKWQKLKPVIYSLGLGVYCTSWAFYGVSGQAANTGWWMAPTYAGAIIVYILAWPVVLRVASLCKEHQITSLADFIARRYGQSSNLAGLITLVSIVAVIPYIALQFRSIKTSIETIQVETSTASAIIDDSLLFTLVLAAFSILFGTRRVRSSEHNPGLMLAIAFESIIKFIAIWAIGFYVCFGLFNGPTDLLQQASDAKATASIDTPPAYVYLVQTFIGMMMMLCLPRQFHMCFIENNNGSELRVSRWLFPLYLIGMGVFALPMAYAGLTLFGVNNSDADFFLLSLPMAVNNEFMTMVAFLGGFSAASSMVIVASIVLSIMVSNDLITPWFVRRANQFQRRESLSPARLLTIRRITILVVLLFAYLYQNVTQNFGLLANTGLMAMSLLAQFAPAILLGIYWRHANCKAAFYGISAGALCWLYTLFLPTLLQATQTQASWLQSGPLSIDWLVPTALFGLQLEFIAHGLTTSLLVNLAVFIYFSLASTPRVFEQVQAASYLKKPLAKGFEQQTTPSLSIGDIADLMSRFMPRQEVESQLKIMLQKDRINFDQVASPALQDLAQRELSAIIGGPSAKLILDSVSKYRDNLLTEVVELVDEASEVFKFNRSLLQSTIQNIDQGISVVDKELRLVAWNRRYIEMFDYPEDEIYVGRSVADVIRFNHARGLLTDNDIEKAVDKRVAFIQSGEPYKYQRAHSDGKVIEIKGNPLPGGGFVTTYTDVTDFIESQKTLEEINLLLEQRVEQRTQDLTQLNASLEDARQQAEQANLDKTRYFAAISHDLLQPVNAASLFASVLQEKQDLQEVRSLSSNIKQSLTNAEQLLTSVLELTKLDAGAVKVAAEEFAIGDVISPIVDEFSLILAEKGLAFETQLAEASVRSDKTLLKRVLQNLMSNAVKYTDAGGVTLSAVQNNTKTVRISVTDTGRGIKPEDQTRIFNDFEQLDKSFSEQGLGLGLAVASRICRMLGHPLTLNSEQGQGSKFCVELPLVNHVSATQKQTIPKLINKKDLVGVRILVIDNDQQVLNAMQAQLEEWGCEVHSAKTQQQVKLLIDSHNFDVFVVDYHLDDGLTGVALLQTEFEETQTNVPIIINSADHNENIREQISELGYQFLPKPTKPAALKRMIKQGIRATHR